MKSISFRKLRSILTKHDNRFIFYKRKGKGSHRAIEHPNIDGKSVAYTIPVHKEGDDIKKAYLTKLKKDFKLPKDIFE